MRMRDGAAIRCAIFLDGDLHDALLRSLTKTSFAHSARGSHFQHAGWFRSFAAGAFGDQRLPALISAGIIPRQLASRQSFRIRGSRHASCGPAARHRASHGGDLFLFRLGRIVEKLGAPGLEPGTQKSKPLPPAALHHLSITRAITIPCGRDPIGLPFGIQIIARRGPDRMLLRAAIRIEDEIGALPH